MVHPMHREAREDIENPLRHREGLVEARMASARKARMEGHKRCHILPREKGCQHGHNRIFRAFRIDLDEDGPSFGSIAAISAGVMVSTDQLTAEPLWCTLDMESP